MGDGVEMVGADKALGFHCSVSPGELRAVSKHRLEAGDGCNHRASFFHLIEGEDFGYVLLPKGPGLNILSIGSQSRPQGS